MSSKKRKTPDIVNEEKEEATVEEVTTELCNSTNAIADTVVVAASNGHVDNDSGEEDDDDDDDDDSSDDDLVLEGVVTRNHDVSDEDDDDDDDDEEEEEEEEEQKEESNPTKTDTPTTTTTSDGITSTDTKIAPSNDNKVTVTKTQHQPNVTKNTNKKKKKKKKRRSEDDDDDDDDVLNVDFTFCDMDEKYFHGIKSLLHSSSTYYQSHSTVLSDLMIDNVAIGTIVSTTMEDVHEPDVFGFASILNIKTYQEHDVIQHIKNFCIQHCPNTISPSQKKELELCFSGTTKRPVGLFLHGRMINMPMEIVHVLQEQLIQDMDWAINQTNTDDTEEERKAHDFGAFIRLAPAERDSLMILYKYFDDEIFMERSEFHYVVDVQSSNSNSSSNTNSASSTKQCIVVMVLTKTGHRMAMNDLKQLIHER